MDEDTKEVLKQINARVNKLESSPKVEQYYRLSKDGKYIIHETKIVDIKPLNYIKTVIAPKLDNPKTTEEIIHS